MTTKWCKHLIYCIIDKYFFFYPFFLGIPSSTMKHVTKKGNLHETGKTKTKE